MAPRAKKVDPEQVKVLASINCSIPEIAAVVKLSPRMVSYRFAKEMELGRAQGRASLKRRMWEIAMGDSKGAVPMCIWLSKQMLGYSEKVVIDDETQEQYPEPTAIATTSRVIKTEDGNSSP